MNTKTVWIVDDDDSIRWVIERALQQADITYAVFESADDALDQLCHEQPHAIISDINMPGINGLEFLAKLNVAHPNIPVIITTAHSDLDSAVASHQQGAFDYLPKPFDIDEMLDMIQRALEVNERSLETSDTAHDSSTSNDLKVSSIIGEAPAMQEVFRVIGRLSKSSINVLINGESGTGKELIAQALHDHSDRNKKNFIAINMAAIPKDLIESELFGHEKGSFTGASSSQTGRFEQADGGTLFLDEIGDMPAEAQTRLLRVLSSGEFYRVGGQKPIKTNVRILTATHQDLLALVEEKRFREDLYHRLNVIRIQLPALRERKEDIQLLSDHFLKNIAEELNMECKQLDAPTQQLFQQLSWPGNVRQLENTCRWLTVMAPGTLVHPNDLPPDLLDDKHVIDSNNTSWKNLLSLWVSQQLTQNADHIATHAQAELEKILITQTLNFTQGKRAKAAKLLGWGRNTLTRKIQEHGL
ncbi:MAG: nitrogen regulation protein NR(I) [Pseudomonadota bacterium]